MKKTNLFNNWTLYYLCFIMSLNFFVGCKKETEEVVEIFEPGNMSFGSMTSLKNGVKWTASALAQREKDTTFSVQAGTLAVINGDTLSQENIGILKIKYRIGVYQILPYSPQPVTENQVRGGYARLADDEILEFFMVDESAKTNFFEVTVLDSLHVEGKLDVTVIGERTKKKLHFSNGHFTSRFYK